mmetsp:Transcript_89515/g.253664  ORF Transcript_89515/g.253664 Transcript_89515/m.253664 type:complete len:505 (-) Transcript_89515:50-1564(-)
MQEGLGRQSTLQRIPLASEAKQQRHWAAENGDGLTDSDEPKKEWKIEDAIEEVGRGRTQWVLLVITGLTFTADAAEVTYISLITETLRYQWHLTDTDIATVQSVVFIGMVLGAPVWGYIADRLGRRIAFLLSSSVICISGFATALAANFPSLVAFRCVVGVGVAGLPVGFDILAEALPVAGRGKWLLYIEYFWTLGSIYINLCGWLTLTPTDWRLFTALAAVPTLISSIAGYLYLPESPRWLVEQGRGEEALEIVNRWAQANGKTHLHFDALERPRSAGHHGGGLMDLVRVPRLRNSAAAMAVIWFSFGIAYYSILLLLPRIFEDEVKKGAKFDFVDLATTSLFEIFGVAIGIAMIEYPGRVCTQFTFYSIGAVAALALSFRSLPKVVLTAFASLGRLAEMAASCATWVHTPELFPTRLRGEAHAGLNLVSKIGAACAPFILSKRFTQLQAGCIVSSMSLAGGIAALCLRETAGQDLSTGLDDPSEVEMSSAVSSSSCTSDSDS